MKCIIYYKDQENVCFCGKLKECQFCSSGKQRKGEEDACTVGQGEFCTCRLCGYAKRADSVE
ncbi:hypothetical protein ACUH7Y_09535 [Clostridium beijerinckii]|uniref:Uncharacterized protein n=1 Tax=Clostridium beijerinckii TaxID=1520 RepID=A0A7X9SME5_CLOBE|nr:hypothetical protein [Clostridium beijerinckii]NMF04554.1 hypothetical protein [Clostridium beijerinckii]